MEKDTVVLMEVEKDEKDTVTDSTPVAGGGRTTLMLLADSRFPSGGHAHSAGMEEAVASGEVGDLDDVAAWAEGVLWTSGLTTAGLAAAACELAGRPRDTASTDAWSELDTEADARTPSPVQRAVTRRLGRQLLRTACRVWPSDVLDELARRWPDGPHRPVVFGATTSVAGGSPSDAAIGEAYGAVAVPVVAALRLLGLDPVSTTSVLSRLAPAMEEVAAVATLAACGPPALLPARSAPIVDLCAQSHSTREGALFAS